MKKITVLLLCVIGVVVLGFALLAASFRMSMKPDPNREKEITEQAEAYLDEHFNANFEVFDTLYDNMGNFAFEYAAKVRDVQSDTEFLVYSDEGANGMVDTYISKKWANEIEQEIRPYVIREFGNRTEMHVFIDDEIGREMNIDPLATGSYQDYAITPTVRLGIPRKKKASDEQQFTEFISFLIDEGELQHGRLIIAYVAETGEISEDEEWSREF